MGDSHVAGIPRLTPERVRFLVLFSIHGADKIDEMDAVDFAG